MSTQPEALRLADLLERMPLGECDEQAAAELRRLHELALEQQGRIYALEMARSMEQKTAKLKQAALLEALKMIAGTAQCIDNLMSDKDIARAAIKAAEDGK